jgi:hypothetical protein
VSRVKLEKNSEGGFFLTDEVSGEEISNVVIKGFDVSLTDPASIQGNRFFKREYEVTITLVSYDIGISLGGNDGR